MLNCLGREAGGSVSAARLLESADDCAGIGIMSRWPSWRSSPFRKSLKNWMPNPLDSCRLMFVLGAGASVPLGMPTTKSLLEKLENKTRLGKLAAEIHRSAAYRFRIDVGDVNIEDFFEYLYELQLMIWFAQRSELTTLLPGFTALATVTDIARNCLSAIQRNADRLLHRTCGDCSGAKVDALWRPILEFVSGHRPVVPIFTLNYDWTSEKLAIEDPQRYHLTDGTARRHLGCRTFREDAARAQEDQSRALPAARLDLLAWRHEINGPLRGADSGRWRR